MSKRHSKMLAFAGGLMIFVYLIYHIFFASISSVKTESAIWYSTSDTISGTAYIIRDEQLITSDVSGVRSFCLSNGSRVAKNGVVAEIYDSESEVSAKQQADEIDEQISNLKSIQNSGGNIVVDIDQINNRISDSLNNLLNTVENGNMMDFDSVSDDYFTLLNRRLVAIGEEQDFSSLITSLQAKRDDLLSSVGGAKEKIRAENSGYFVSGADGYEGYLTPSVIEDINPEFLKNLKKEDISGRTDIVGKTVSDVDWYIAVQIDFEQALKFKEGESLFIQMPLSTVDKLPVKVKKINKSSDGGDSVIVFSCNYMNGELSCIRTQPIKIIMSDYEGLKINSKSVRIVDGKKGVYVLSGQELKFKPIDILYNGNGFLICKMDQSLSDGLSLYDEVVIKGKDLYDGKVVKQ